MKIPKAIIINMLGVLLSYQCNAENSILSSGIITGNDVLLRINAGTNYDNIAILPINSEVYILGRNEQKCIIQKMEEYWINVKLKNGLSGWVYGYYVDYFYNYTWTKYSTNSIPDETSDWWNYSYSKTNKRVNYSFSYPELWYISDSSIRDIRDRKVGELCSVFLLPADDIKTENICKINRSITANGKYKLIKISCKSKNEIYAPDIKSILSYFIVFPPYGFLFQFYLKDKNINEELIYDKIISSFRFE